MADDWKPGDLALCVDDSPSDHDYNLRPLRRNAYYIVEGLYAGGWGLHLFGIPEPEGAPTGWLSDRFRKISPHTPDAEDAETITLLTGKPAQVSA